MSKEDAEALIARLRKGRLPELTLERTQLADGTVVERWQIDNDDDVELYRQATAPRGRQAELAALYEKNPLMAMLDGYEPPDRPPAPARMPSPPSLMAEAISVGEARDAWLKSLEGSTTPQTLTIKGTAINMLVDYIGSNRQMHTIGRPDMTRFYQHLRDKGNSAPSIYNKQSYLGGAGGFFDWATNSGHYLAVDNPARPRALHGEGKASAKKLDFRAFTMSRIQAHFAPEQFARLSPGGPWAALLGLYTGARAGEVGQLLLTDVVEADGVPVLHVTDEGENQRPKSEASKRVVPIHAGLVALGFLDYVQRLRDRGDTRPFPSGGHQRQERRRKLDQQSIRLLRQPPTRRYPQYRDIPVASLQRTSNCIPSDMQACGPRLPDPARCCH
ncbi:integrase [Stenotrophomonas riyadhensis]|uniref:integrase n=1 Tax=Stenotrophomonas riyadhensis TaxID=2859893 RepID=UPI00330687D0